MPRMTTLASSADYRITLHQAGDDPSEICLITFGGQPSDLGDSGFGTDYALRNEWDTIYVAQRKGTQYQGLSLETFLNAVAPVVVGRDPVCYGPSLGAYAAFYYGGIIDARIIGGAPMFPAWPKFESNHYTDLEITHLDLSDVPRSQKPPVVIYDPTLPRDRKMVGEMLLPAYPDLREITYNGAGHTVLITLQQSGQLEAVLSALIAEDRVIPIEPLIEGSALYHRTRGRLLKTLDPDGSKRELELSLRILPSRQTLAILLTMLMKHNRLTEAQDWIDRAEGSGDKNLTITPNIKSRLREAGLRVSDSSQQPSRAK